MAAKREYPSIAFNNMLLPLGTGTWNFSPSSTPPMGTVTVKGWPSACASNVYPFVAKDVRKFWCERTHTYTYHKVWERTSGKVAGATTSTKARASGGRGVATAVAVAMKLSSSPWKAGSGCFGCLETSVIKVFQLFICPCIDQFCATVITIHCTCNKLLRTYAPFWFFDLPVLLSV